MKTAPADQSEIHIEQTGPETFILAVTFDGRRFDCGSYLNRGAAMQAGRLFVERKRAEQTGRKKHPWKAK